nr:DUF1549 domain-containing protein [Cytophagales bacterium]
MTRNLIFILLVILNACGSPGKKDTVDPEALFAHEVTSIIASKCIGCHGGDPKKIEGGLDFRNYENLLVGGNSGKPAIVPGNSKQSLLYQSILRVDEDLAMPPKDGDKLSEIDLQIIRDWIDGGAPWPSEERIAAIKMDTEWQYGNRIRVKTSGGLSETWENRPYEKENLWAYYPVEKPEIPWGELDPNKNHPIDAFLADGRAELNIPTAPSASDLALIRRVTIDLIGLPPTKDEIEGFLGNKDPNAYQHLIDRLLASPQYGEQWARHWLDVVRYADTGGFSNDYVRPNAWRYRDYVIRAFNDDKPYDQFVMEQLAGDEIDPDDPEMLIATGFLRMGPWEHTAMSVAAETRQYYLDDVTNIVGEAFLSTPLNCAKCHDHKYDPIPARDYYSIQAVFATTQFAERPAPFLPEENTEVTEFEKQRILDWINITEKEDDYLANKEEEAAKRWYEERGLTYLPKRARRKLPEDQQPPRYLGLTFEELGYRKVLNKRMQLLRKQKERFEPFAFSVYNGPVNIRNSQNRGSVPENLNGEPPNTNILAGGSVYAPIEPVEAGVMSIIENLAPESKKINIKIPNGMESRRLGFAKWLTHPDNPILARSMVNRIWQHHFGQGICETPNNFGATGGKPTHPELLDWLTSYFIAHDYSVKEMHRLIMTSRAYRFSSSHPDWSKVNEVDPDNELLSYFNPRRMDAEELKDAMLYISGELNTKMGGFPTRPEINMEAALQPRHIMGSIAPAYQPSRTPEERNRRTIYAERYRTLADPYLEVFNQPGTDMSCEARSESTVTPQVFTMFNGQNVRTRSLVYANRLMNDFDGQENRLKEAIYAIFNREARPDEIEECLHYLEKMTKYHQDNKPPKIDYPTEVEREMFEEMTGEPFSFKEELDIYKNYIPDLQPWQVDASTRALADLIAVYFNSNEFIYVY